MKQDKTYQLLLTKMQEISLVPPQQLGPFTNMYKNFVPYLKFAPWRMAAFVSFFTSILLYLVLGPILVKIVSLLQFGF